MRFVKIVEPDDGDTFEIRIKNTLNSFLKENKGKHIVKLEIFVNSAHIEAFNDEKDCIQQAIKTTFKNKIPASSIFYVPICNGSEFTIMYQMYDDNLEIEYKTLLAHPYVIVKYKTGIELFSGGICFNEDSLLFSAQRCFDLAEQILMAEDMHFGHIYRQWNYIPSAKQTTQRTHLDKDGLSVFDEIQDFYYEETLFTNGKPISNNIHHVHDTLLINFIAFAADENKSKAEPKQDISWLNNHTDLKVKRPIDGATELWFSTKPTLAIAASDNNTQQLQKQDIEKQTIQHLKCIVELTKASQSQLNTEAALSFLKVSVSQGQDYKKVEELIKGSLPQIQTLFVNCIPNNPTLLVEIEGLIS